MFPGYEQYWRAIFADPDGMLPLTGRKPTAGEVEYARFANRATHLVLSTTPVETNWANVRVVNNLDEIRRLKRQGGRDMHAVGGATLVSSLLNAGLVDELRIVGRPLLPGGGKAMFKDVAARHAFLTEAVAIDDGLVRLRYVVR